MLAVPVDDLDFRGIQRPQRTSLRMMNDTAQSSVEEPAESSSAHAERGAVQERARMADERDREADRRQSIADERDRIADERDRAAAHRRDGAMPPGYQWRVEAGRR